MDKFLSIATEKMSCEIKDVFALVISQQIREVRCVVSRRIGNERQHAQALAH
jgi:hypothetical protein